jgi:hypothetical protein
MAFAQTVTSSSIFSSPFHDPSNDPEAFGSYTSCQGPPAQLNASPVAKLRRHVASALAPKHPKQNTISLKTRPFDTEIVILDFVPESKPSTTRASSAPPARRNTSKRPATSHSLDFGPFDANIVMLPFIADDVHNEPIHNRKVRRISSRATVASTSWSAAATQSPADDMTTRTMTPYNSRPTTAAGDGGQPPHGAGQPGAKGCQCPCRCAKYHFANIELCKCACSCKNCHCKGRKAPNKILRMLEGHGYARRRTDDSDPKGEKNVDGGQHARS